MIALILAAGYGTRLYPLAEHTPKALLPVGGEPILGHLIQKLRVPGLTTSRIILVSNHKYAENFRQWLGSSRLDIPWDVLDDGSTSEENRLGSMGDLAFAIRGRSIDEDLLVLGSDNLLRDDLASFYAFAQKKSPAATLGAYPLPDPAQACRYGVLTVGADSKILSFEEKPKHPTSSLVSTAIYFFPHAAVHWVLEYVGSERSADTLGAFVRWLIARKPVFAYPFQGPWFDIGDIASYTHAQESFIP